MQLIKLCFKGVVLPLSHSIISSCHCHRHFQPPPKETENDSSQPEITGFCIKQHLQNQKINLQSLVRKKTRNLAHCYVIHF